MVPAAEADSAETANDVGEEVERVEVAAVGENALDDFGADAEDQGADKKGQVEVAAAGGVEDPVEDEGEEEEGDDMEEFVVGLELGRDGG